MALDPKKLKSIKVKLAKEQQRLMKELEKSRDYPDYGTSEDDNVQEIEAFGQNVNLQDKFQKALTEIEIALNKIENQTYGVCDRCRGPIQPNRLAAFPEATHCLSCEKMLARRSWWKFWKKPSR